MTDEKGTLTRTSGSKSLPLRKRKAKQGLLVFDNLENAGLFAVFSETDERLEYEVVSSQELSLGDAYRIASSGTSGPAALIDLARENGFKQRKKASGLKADIEAGQKASELLAKLGLLGAKAKWQSYVSDLEKSALTL